MFRYSKSVTVAEYAVTKIIMYRTMIHNIVLLCVIVCCFSACADKRLLQQQEGVKLGVLPFMQPARLDELLAGGIAEYKTLATTQELEKLDVLLQEALQKLTHFTVVPMIFGNKTPQIPMLNYLVSLGEQQNVDYIVVPQVLDWKPAVQGKQHYVPATVIINYYLIDVKQKMLVARANYFENDPLTMNDLRYKRVPNGMFYRTYVDRYALAEESILMMLEDFYFVYDRKNKNLFYQF